MCNMKCGNGVLPAEHKDFEQTGRLYTRLFAHSLRDISTPPPPEKYIPVL
ncbi:MAG: hypothetical protein LBK66_09565 [Spirochaetaceae bacterium]|nr:hypothetical protein [Spirochaetaceae bacterium]